MKFGYFVWLCSKNRDGRRRIERMSTKCRRLPTVIGWTSSGSREGLNAAIVMERHRAPIRHHCTVALAQDSGNGRVDFPISSGPRTPGATSLLPETHIAVVRAGRIVRTMEDAWELLRREHGTMPRAVNFISGPSRTADIEQTLVLGAHGPYRVNVIMVNG